MHPNGRFVFCSNRVVGLEGQVTCFSVDPETGVPEETSRRCYGTQGQVPREINLLCGGSLLLAGNQDTDTIIAYDVDMETGVLSQRGELIPCPTPVCLLEIEVTEEVR